MPDPQSIPRILTERAMLLGETHYRGLIAQAVKGYQSGLFDFEEPEPLALSYSLPLGGAEVGKKIAVLPIQGILMKGWDWWSDSSCNTVECIALLKQAVEDGTVSAIVLDIDSPGGYVNGSVELADAVAIANESKPVWSVIRGMCCSGAYWIASQAGSIIARPESEVGNIGVYSVLRDTSKAYEQMGLTMTLVASGQFKGLGADGKVSDDYVSDTRRIVLDIFEQFAAAVAEGRDLDPADLAKYTDGRAYLGNQAGQLVDKIASSWEEAMEIVTGVKAPSGDEMTRATTAAIAEAVKATPAAAPINLTINTAPQAAAKEDPKPADDGKKPDDKGKDKPAPADDGKMADIHKALDDATASAKSHRDMSRKALDAANDHAGDPTPETVGKAHTCMKMCDMAKAEGDRARKAWLSVAGDPDDGNDGDDDPDDDDDDPDEKKPGDTGQSGGKDSRKNSKVAAADFEVFGDVGFKWFHEGKPFHVAAREYIGKLKTDHAAALAAMTAENDELRKRLGAARAETPPPASPRSPRKRRGVRPGSPAWSSTAHPSSSGSLMPRRPNWTRCTPPGTAKRSKDICRARAA